MEYIKILEENNIHIVLGLENGEISDADISRILYGQLAKLAYRHGTRRFTLHVVSIKPRPLYLEDLRNFIQNNIVYSLVIRYHDLNFQELNKIVNDLLAKNKHVYGIVEKEFAELASFLEGKGIEVVKI